MRKPKLQLKNVKTFRGMEGIGLNADVWIDGVKCLFVMDSANGGCFDYEQNINHKNPELVKQKIAELEAYIETLPKEPLMIDDEQMMRDGIPLEMKVDLDQLIDEQFRIQEERKERRKMEKLMLTSILFGKPAGDRYSMIQYKIPLSKIVQVPAHKVHVQNKIDEIKRTHCTNGIRILNTNLELLGFTV